jgi:formylglycine-generating enzyme required for sulfatase activity
VKTYPTKIGARAILILLALVVITAGAADTDTKGDAASAKMVLVKGGSFEMGDVFGEGEENERPVHKVTVTDFFISKYEVTVAQFRRFVEKTGYKTSAEGPNDNDARQKIMAQTASGELSREDMQELRERLLELSGAGYWDTKKRAWIGYNPLTNWKNPGIEQTDADPVLAMSMDDVMQFCNWLSEGEGLPVAYDLDTGEILDKYGDPTLDITAVKGYRVPTEAEWEFSARERGLDVRFGNGKNTARSTEINFLGDEGDYEYLQLGEYPGKTTPVGSYSSNSLGLCDMSGNAWEWVGDKYSEYTSESQVNPIVTDGRNYILRGGRWGGDASEARVFHRSPWPRSDRCNNSGFRIARTK